MQRKAVANRFVSSSSRVRFRSVFALQIWLFSAIFPACGVAQEAITFGTDWRAQAEHGGFYYAKAEGLYEAVGLDVTIRQGGPSVNHSQLIAARRIDFGMLPNSFVTANFAEAGIPVVTLAAMFQKDPAVLITHAGSGATGLGDLKGRKIMISPDTRVGIWPFLKGKFDFTDDQIAPYTFNIAPWLVDEDAVQQGYLTSEPFAMRQAGASPKVFMIADAGFDGYAAMIATHQSRIDSDPDQVRRFVAASIEGWRGYLLDDPSRANELIKRDNPDMTDDLLAYARAEMIANDVVFSASAGPSQIGIMTLARWQSFADAMVNAGVYKPGLDITKAVSTSFVGR